MFLNRAGVSNHYSSKVRVGNWSEEQELEELRMKEYIHRKEKGGLLVHSISQHMNASLAEVGLSYCPDGLVHIGDHVMIYSVCTEGVLSCDPADLVGTSDKGFAVTTSGLVKAHVARNVFVIEAYGSESAAAQRVGEPLKLGQQFRLRLNPKLAGGEPYYLQSQPVSGLAASKVSRKQLVSMSTLKSFDTVWKAQWKEIGRRFEMEGQAVPANSEVVLVHAPTNTALSSSKLTYYNDFGLEYEVCGHSHVDIRKSQGLYAELQGRTTTDIPFRKENSPNHFAFLTAASEEMDTIRQDATAAASSSYGFTASAQAQTHMGSILANAREELLSRGPDHLLAFLRTARSLDQQRRNYMAIGDFRKLLLQHGVKLQRTEDFDALARLFDSADGYVDYLAFLRQIRGRLSAPRADVISAAWASLDQFGAGTTSLQTLASAFDPTADPDVKLGRKGTQQAAEAMLSKLAPLAIGGRLGREDFEEAQAITSTFVESDAYFVDLIASTWRLKK